MKASVCYEYDSALVVEDVELKPLGPRDVRLRIDATGVCHSDLSMLKGSIAFIKPPMIMGHESAATVLEIGSQVTRVSPGDVVITAFAPNCGDCWWCVHDEAHLCEHAWEVFSTPRATALDGRDLNGTIGTFAEEAVLPETMLVKITSSLPAEQLALVGCAVTTGVCAVLETAAVPAGASVAVFGCGGVGLSSVQAARLVGAEIIIAVDPVALKRDTALSLGATHAIDPTTTPVGDAIRELTGGRGADHAFEAVGHPAVALDAFDSVRRGGAVTVVGAARAGSVMELPTNLLQGQGKRLLGSRFGSAQIRRDFPRIVALAESGRLDLASMVTAGGGLDDLPAAFAAMEDGSAIRSVLRPNG